MDHFTKWAISGVIGFTALSVVLSGFAWAQTSKLSLPLPKALPIISLFFPLLASIIVSLLARYFQARKNRSGLTTVSAYLFSLVPLIVLVLSCVFAFPTSLFACTLESQWQHLFRIKDDQAIRAIQDTFRCCGLNSAHDRAWPFPGKETDARACQRTQGYNIRCLDPWERQESRAAGMVALANFSNWVLVILLTYIIQTRQQSLQSLCFGIFDSDHRARLIEGRGSGDAEVHGESGGQPSQAYSDVAHGADGPSTTTVYDQQANTGAVV